MQKKVLVIYFSQSGQLMEITRNFCLPLEEAGMLIDSVQFAPASPFPFPWTTESFFDVMPESVMAVPVALAPITFKYASYDLIVLGFQAWFLSPSIPITSLMQLESFTRLLANTPVITITGARNMWVSAFEKLRIQLRGAGARHVGHVALVDRHPNLVSIFSIFHWMLSGTKTKWLNIFPLPGVSDQDIQHVRVYGKMVLPFLLSNEWSGLQPALIQAKAVEIKFHLLFIETKAAMMFKLWARRAIASRNRHRWLTAFRYYLFIALFLLAPLVFLIDLIFFKPFLFWYVKKQKDYYYRLQ